jgi:hypothetical protein
MCIKFSAPAIHQLNAVECHKIAASGVLSHARGKGVWTNLLDFCEARARERKVSIRSLGAVAKNPAKSLNAVFCRH